MNLDKVLLIKLIRSTSARQSNEYPQHMFVHKNKGEILINQPWTSKSMEGDYANDKQRASERSMAGCLNKSRLGSRKKNLMLVREDKEEGCRQFPITKVRSFWSPLQALLVGGTIEQV